MRLSILTLGCCLIANQALAEVYRYVDAHGNTVFTDSPPEQVDAKRVELPAINSLPAPSSNASSGNAPTSEPVDADTYNQFSIHLPSEEAIRSNNGDFTIDVRLEPKLGAQHSLQLIVDGQAYGEPSNGSQVKVHNLDRGEHSIAVQILSGDKVVQQSSAQTIYIQRTHVNAPPRRSNP